MGIEEQIGRIEINPEVCAAKPAIRGTSIPVVVILDHLAEGEDWDSILSGFPELSREDIRAALIYAKSAVEHTAAISDSP